MQQKRRWIGWFLLWMALMAGAALASEIDGKWKFVFQTPLGARESVMELTSDGENLTGKSDGRVFKGSFRERKVELNGEAYSTEGGYGAKLKITGKLEGEKIAGEAVWDSYTMSVTATRVK